ncbi:MAG: cupin domain-containing protein [Tepidiformaceae bacterium]
MPGIEMRDFANPDEVRTPELTRIALVGLAGGQIGQYTFAPGWRWSECIKPVAKTETCQVDHIGVVISGRLGASHVDGTEIVVGPGQVYRIGPGHDGWTVGDEPAVVVEFQGAAGFGKA